MSWNHKSMAEMVSDDILEWALKKYAHLFPQNMCLSPSAIPERVWLGYIEEYWDEYFAQYDEKELDNFAPIRYDDNEDPIDY